MGEDRERLRVDREHRPQIGVGAAFLETLLALERVVLHVGLGHAEIELAGLDGVHVESGPAGRFDRTADAVRLAILVEQPADRAAGTIIDAGHTTGPNRHELLLRRCGAVCEQKRGRQGCNLRAATEYAVVLHLILPWCFSRAEMAVQ